MSNAGNRPLVLRAVTGGQSHTLAVTELGDGRFRVAIDGQERLVDARPTGKSTYSLLIDSQPVEVSVAVDGEEFAVSWGGRTSRVRFSGRPGGPGPTPAKGAGEGRCEVRAAMPGKLVALLVAEGAKVGRGQGLLTIEAMKMENEVQAPRAGKVTSLRVQPGQAVEAGELLAVIE